MLAGELGQRFPDEAAFDPRQLAHDSHAMVSTAESLGLFEFAEVCRDIEKACTTGSDYGSALSTLWVIRDRTLRKIAVLRDSHVA